MIAIPTKQSSKPKLNKINGYSKNNPLLKSIAIGRWLPQTLLLKGLKRPTLFVEKGFEGLLNHSSSHNLFHDIDSGISFTGSAPDSVKSNDAIFTMPYRFS